MRRARARRAGGRCAAPAVLLAVLVAGCGGGDAPDPAADAAATAFRTQSQGLCRTARSQLASAVGTYRTRVDEAARAGDAVVLRQDTLRFFDDVQRTMTTFFESAAGTGPPDGDEDWRRRTGKASDRLTQILDVARGRVGAAELSTTAGLQVLSTAVGQVGDAVPEVATSMDTVFSRFGVSGCSSKALGGALAAGRGTATTP